MPTAGFPGTIRSTAKTIVTAPHRTKTEKASLRPIYAIIMLQTFQADEENVIQSKGTCTSSRSRPQRCSEGKRRAFASQQVRKSPLEYAIRSLRSRSHSRLRWLLRALGTKEPVRDPRSRNRVHERV